MDCMLQIESGRKRRLVVQGLSVKRGLDGRKWWAVEVGKCVLCKKKMGREHLEDGHHESSRMKSSGGRLEYYDWI